MDIKQKYIKNVLKKWIIFKYEALQIEVLDCQ